MSKNLPWTPSMTTDETETPVRTVLDAEGRTWHAYVVVARIKFDPESEKRRRNWLALETSGERRYISPVPAEWSRWSDEQLLTEIASAKQDLRT
jgi:hypothetical protein